MWLGKRPRPTFNIAVTHYQRSRVSTLLTATEEEDLRTDREVRREGALPL